MVLRGVAKFFELGGGFGVILPEGAVEIPGGENKGEWFHVTSVVGKQVPTEGTHVEYELRPSERHPGKQEAHNVRVIPGGEEAFSKGQAKAIGASIRRLAKRHVALEEKVDANDARQSAAVNALDTKVSEKIAALDTKLDAADAVRKEQHEQQLAAIAKASADQTARAEELLERQAARNREATEALADSLLARFQGALDARIAAKLPAAAAGGGGSCVAAKAPENPHTNGTPGTPSGSALSNGKSPATPGSLNADLRRKFSPKRPPPPPLGALKAGGASGIPKPGARAVGTA